MSAELIKRIKKLLVDKGLSGKELAERTGIKEAKFKYYMSGKPKIPYDYISKVAQELKVNIEVLTGNKNSKSLTTLAKHSTITLNESEHNYSSSDSYRDIGAVNSEDSSLVEYSDPERTSSLSAKEIMSAHPTYEMSIPGYPGHKAFPVYGDSMEPKYEAGTIVLCKLVEDKEKIPHGKVYYIFMKEFKVLRRLLKSKKPGYVIASCDNHKIANSSDGKMYSDQEIPLSSIEELFIVKGRLIRDEI